MYMSKTFDAISEPLPRRVQAGLSKIAMVMRHEAWAQDGARGLTPTQAQVLALLQARGAMRLSAIADELAVKQPTASDAVTALTRKGLVEKQSVPDDGRARSIRLTEAGAAVAAGRTDWPDLLRTVVADLPEAEQAALLKTLTRMIRSLQQQGAIPVQRMCVNCRYFRPNAHAEAHTPHHCAYVDAPFGDRHLRLDCPEHAEADAALASANWRRFTTATHTQEPGS
jgi:DNA-binding MarR family transcriptional regulator